MTDCRHNDERILTTICSVEDRFNAHLLVYRENGKESKRVADALERMMEHSAARDRKVDAMYTRFTDDEVLEKGDTKRKENIVLWGRVISAVAIIAAAGTWTVKTLLA